MKKVLRATAVAATLLTVPFAALAADLPQRPGPAYVPVMAPLFTWTGGYIGGNIGGGWANSAVSSNFGSVWDTSRTVFIGGFQAGYNYQMGSFVIGVEGDFDFTTGSKSSGFVTTVPFGPLQAVSSLNWIGTAAARFGFAADRTLIYGKVGYGWSKTELTLQNPAGIAVGGTNNTNGGLLLGGGIEYAFTNNWTAKIEYNWLNLESRTFTLPGANTVTVSPNINMVKLGANFKF